MISNQVLNAIGAPYAAVIGTGAGLCPVGESAVVMLNQFANDGRLSDTTISDGDFFNGLPEFLSRDSVTGSAEPMTYKEDGATVMIPPSTNHESFMDAVVENNVKMIVGLQDYARNIVQPFIGKVLESFEQPTSTNPVSKWQIMPIRIPDCYRNPVVDALFENYNSWPQYPNVITTPQQIVIPENLEVPVTGRKRFDDLLAGVISDLGLTVSEILVKFFNDFSPAVSGMNWTKGPLRLAQWLLLQYYLTNPWADSGMGTAPFETYLRTGIQVLSSWMGRFVKLYADELAIGLVIRDYDLDERIVYVNEDNYAKLRTELGGNPEHIYGAIYLEGTNAELDNYRLESFKGNLDNCFNAYKHKYASADMESQQSFNDQLKAYMNRGWMAALNDLDDDLLPPNKSRAELMADMRELTKHSLNRYAAEDIAGYVTNIACASVFKHTDCGVWMRGIHERIKQDVPVEQAVLETVIEYVFEWALAGVEVSFAK